MFEVLHDVRGLSVHFMLDLDGTIYQTLDVKEKAWHATIANDRSIGIEVANIGAYPAADSGVLDRWYQRGAGPDVQIVIPDPAGTSGLRDRALLLRPARGHPVEGKIHDQLLRQYDFTDQQYRALARLTATLCTLFPRIRCDYPRDASGSLLRRKLSGPDFARYRGLLGHYHVQENKVDPGPAFQWDRVIDGARAILRIEGSLRGPCRPSRFGRGHIEDADQPSGHDPGPQRRTERREVIVLDPSVVEPSVAPFLPLPHGLAGQPQALVDELVERKTIERAV